MEDLLSNQSLANSGVFDYALIEKRLTSFLNGDDRHFFGLWEYPHVPGMAQGKEDRIQDQRLIALVTIDYYEV